LYQPPSPYPLATGSGCSLTTNLPAGLYACSFTVVATNALCGTASTNLVATGAVCTVYISPSPFTTFAGASNTFVATGVPPGQSYHDWSPTGDVSGDGRTNTVVFTTLTTNQTVSVQYGPGCSQTITGAVVGLVLSNVAFSVANDILQDDGSGAYLPPHWTATNSYPVTYPRNTTGTVSATFWVVPTNFSGSNSVIIQGVGSSGLNIPATTVTVVGVQSTVTLPTTNFSTAFANQVDFLNPLTIDWEYTGGGATFYDAGSSVNPVYITLTNPATANLFHTVVHLACSNGHATDTNAAVANTWALFAGPANVTTWDGTKKLYYYQNGDGWNTATDVAGLLSSQNGNCVAWRNLLLDALLANGISADRVYVSSPGQYFLVRAWNFGSSSFTNTPPYNWMLRFPTTIVDTSSGVGVYGDLTNLGTLDGQNTAPPAEKVFGNHRILGYGGLYYDPSYGVTFSGENNFVDTAVAGYAIERDDLDNPPGYTNLILRVESSTGVYEISFTNNVPSDPSD
jgi:hypothetical protein